MKTSDLKTLFTLLLCTGLLLSCSDDNNNGLIQILRTLAGEDTNVFRPITLDLTLGLDAVSESLTCDEGSLLYRHSGAGNSVILGDYTLELNYCGTPRNEIPDRFEIEIADGNGNKTFLQEKAADSNTAIPKNNSAVVTGQGAVESSDTDNILNSNTESVTLDITGGTGIYTNTTGELSLLIPADFSPGVTSIDMTFMGYIKDQ